MENTIESIKAKIVLLSLMRDEVKEVSPSLLFRSIQHRDDVYYALIEALEELEDELEDLEDKMDREESERESQTKQK